MTASIYRCRKARTVRAAEDGVVDYSGNEQKSHGNLILIW